MCLPACSTSTSDSTENKTTSHSSRKTVEVNASLSDLLITLRDNTQDIPVITHPSAEVTWGLDSDTGVTQDDALSIWGVTAGSQVTWTIFHRDQHIPITSADHDQLMAVFEALTPLTKVRVGWVGDAPLISSLSSVLLIAKKWSQSSAPAYLIGSYQPVKVDREIDDIARWISGLKPRGDSIPAELITHKLWQTHSAILNRLWERSMTPVLDKMQTWVEDKLDATDHRPVFYPFSGPDILNALSLFPYSHDYLMVALENEGVIPPLPKRFDKETRSGLKILRQYIVGHVTRNFFITFEMGGKQKQAALGDHSYTGVASVMLFFLARTGHEIVSVRLIKLSKTGELVDRATDEGNVSGVEIRFRTFSELTPSPHRTRRAIFLRTNISDIQMHTQEGLVPFILNYGQYNTIVKAASYLMHMSIFDDIRSLILSRSLYVITDDTGVPYHFFKEVPDQWRVSLYGKYTRPNPGSKSFANRCQTDLKRDMLKVGLGPLPFKFGYYISKPNLILAQRLTPIAEPIFDRSMNVGVNTIYRGDQKCYKGKQIISRRSAKSTPNRSDSRPQPRLKKSPPQKKDPKSAR